MSVSSSTHNVLMNPIITASSTASLKRSRSLDNHRRFDPSRVPPLPRINSDIALQVFTHRSLRRPNASPAHYGDNERLQELGKAAFDAALVYALFRRRPFLQAVDIDKHSAFLLSSTVFEDWVTAYKLKSKLLCDPVVLPSLTSSQEARSLFHAYVGGLYMFSGPEAVNDWISGLLEQEFETVLGVSRSEVDDYPTVEVPPQKRAKSETMFIAPKTEEQQPPIFFASQPPPTPPPRQPFRAYMPVPKPPPPNPLAPAQPNLPFLPLFNQAAAQRRVTVEYLAELTGPSHAGRWRVKCIVNGICKGEGLGSTKQTAKEEAARQAYYSMGWT
ncbi:hypothetical protein CPB84DRAFT_1841453 [Gymnopilus junonius]|uniref:Uncharacterized protein n=1 Tax=Gymnopilus junonius TaxID=109634 RepID=A0A9P5P0S0_GYMJU|nr:hypothetical protein CPB84DRAFT_1841453 [Gymnopilus junonius]